MNSPHFNRLIILTPGPPPCNATPMQPHSRLNFWLLLTATLSVDAIVASWIVATPFPRSVYIGVLYYGMILGQLSAFCIWAALYRSRSVWIQFSPFVTAVPAAVASAVLVYEREYFWRAGRVAVDLIAYFALQVALLLGALWLLQRTAFWQRRDGARAEWKYSVGQLIILMTIVAILVAMLRDSTLVVGEDRWANLTFLCSTVGLPVVGVILWTSSLHALLRMAGMAASATMFALIFGIVHPFGPATVPSFVEAATAGAHFLIQSIVLSAWLSWGSILPTTLTSPAEHHSRSYG
jgi:hypothetical protein